MNIEKSEVGSEKPERLHFLDSARAALMMLGIPYHSAQFYTDRPWYVRSVVNGGVVEYIGNFLHLFRMHAFYVIAGLFAAMLLERRKPILWLKGRAQRLLIPLVFATIVILPIQDAISDVLNGGDGFLPYRNIIALKLPSAGQTWFLRHLFGYSCCIAAVYGAFKIARYTIPTSRVGMYLAPIGFIAISAAVTSFAFAVLSFAGLSSFIGDGVERFIFYFPFFAGGALLWLFPSLLEKFINGRANNIAVALSLLLLSVLTLLPRDTIVTLPQAAAGYLSGLTGAWLTLNLAFRYLNRANPIVDFYVDGALTIYLTHMLFAIVFGILLVDKLGNSVAEWLIIVILTFASSTIFYGLVRKTPILYYLFNGQSRRVAKSRPSVLSVAVA